jgi:serine protease AprX
MNSVFRNLAFAGLLLGATFAMAAGPSKLSRELAAVPKGQWVKVIVQYQATTDQDMAQAQALAKSDEPTKRLDLIKSVSLTVQSDSLSTFESNSHVSHVSIDHPVFLTSTTTDFYDQAVNAPYAWSSGLNGSGIGVAVIDSGITDQGDFSGANGSRVVYSGNFNNDGIDNAFGHGTHVAGILAGDGANSTGSQYTKTFVGIAPGATLLSFRVLDGNGVGTDSDVIAGIEQAISMQSSYNIRVMNISLGRPVFESYKVDPLCQAVEAAWQAGMVVVVAAGNDGRDNSFNTNGYETITAPGNDPYVITVGAMKTEGTTTRTDDLIASYSSKGPTAFDHYVKPDILAPGNLVVSTMPGPMTLSQEYGPTNRVNGDFFILSGTSMATPVVSGAAVLLIQKTPSLTPDQVKARLMKDATKNFPTSSVAVDPVTNTAYTSYYDIFTVGAGYIDIEAALADTTVATGAALSPSATYNEATGTVTLEGISGVNTVWGSNAVWGSNVVAGSNVVWGSSTTEGFNVVWSTNVVWGSVKAANAESISLAINGER